MCATRSAEQDSLDPADQCWETRGETDDPGNDEDQGPGSHGSKGSSVYRDPIEEDRVWAVFDWDEEGWSAFATDPETPGIMQEAGHLGRPSLGEFLGTFRA